MILYVNGDSHTAAAEAVHPAAFAEDDPDYGHLLRRPHPANLAVSWGRQLATILSCKFTCDAESASSNDRIIRTTRSWMQRNRDRALIIIQWSTWEREEWLIDDVYYQVNASGVDEVPESHQEQYKQFVIDVDWQKKTAEAHDKIWNFHLDLEQAGLDHIFFNGNTSFSSIKQRKDWGTCYMDPYSDHGTFHNQLQNAGVRTVNPHSYHYGEDGHRQWADIVLQYIRTNNLY